MKESDITYSKTDLIIVNPKFKDVEDKDKLKEESLNGIIKK